MRVYPVGIGSPRGTVIEVDGFQLATALDEPTLRTIAERTDGRYVAAADTAALAGVADAIDLEWKVETEHIEVTGLLAAAAGLLVLAGVGLSLLWFGRVSVTLHLAPRAPGAARRAAARRRVRVAAAPQAPAGGAVLERRADPGGGPAARGMEAARPRRAAAGRPRRARPGRGPARG